jgi:hypothetical protein
MSIPAYLACPSADTTTSKYFESGCEVHISHPLNRSIGARNLASSLIAAMPDIVELSVWTYTNEPYAEATVRRASASALPSAWEKIDPYAVLEAAS